MSAISSTEMSTIPVQEIKRRGMSAIDGELVNGPVHIVKSNRVEYVVLSEKDYQALIDDLAEARLAASDMDLRQGRVNRGSAIELIKTVLHDD